MRPDGGLSRFFFCWVAKQLPVCQSLNERFRLRSCFIRIRDNYGRSVPKHLGEVIGATSMVRKRSNGGNRMEPEGSERKGSSLPALLAEHKRFAEDEGAPDCCARQRVALPAEESQDVCGPYGFGSGFLAVCMYRVILPYAPLLSHSLVMKLMGAQSGHSTV